MMTSLTASGLFEMLWVEWQPGSVCEVCLVILHTKAAAGTPEVRLVIHSGP